MPREVWQEVRSDGQGTLAYLHRKHLVDSGVKELHISKASMNRFRKKNSVRSRIYIYKKPVSVTTKQPVTMRYIEHLSVPPHSPRPQVGRGGTGDWGLGSWLNG